MNHYGNAEDGDEADTSILSLTDHHSVMTSIYDPQSTIAPSAHYQEAAAVCQLNPVMKSKLTIIAFAASTEPMQPMQSHIRFTQPIVCAYSANEPLR